MRKFQLFAVAGFLSLGLSSAFAGCEDGQSMAEEAALEEAGDPRVCRVVNSYQAEREANLEVWNIEIKCEETLFGGNVYEVKLEEYEDAICGVKEVKFLYSLE